MISENALGARQFSFKLAASGSFLVLGAADSSL
jgi:hypothetical protein